jgi:hypothetical protein
MTEEHKDKIREANKAHYAAMSDGEKADWHRKRQEGRRRTFALLKELRKSRSIQ